MAKADQIKRLIASYGRPHEFRAAALTIIEDEQRKGHTPLSSSLKRVLDATVQSVDQQRPLTALSSRYETTADLVEIVEPERARKDLVLFPDAQAAIDRILEEQQRADELRRHRLPVRSKILLHGPPGCGKTLTAEVLARELGLPLYIVKIDVIIGRFSARRQLTFAGCSSLQGKAPAYCSLMNSMLWHGRATIQTSTMN